MDKIKEQMEMDSLVSNILKACEEKGLTHREVRQFAEMLRSEIVSKALETKFINKYAQTDYSRLNLMIGQIEASNF